MEEIKLTRKKKSIEPFLFVDIKRIRETSVKKALPKKFNRRHLHKFITEKSDTSPSSPKVKSIYMKTEPDCIQQRQNTAIGEIPLT